MHQLFVTTDSTIGEQQGSHKRPPKTEISLRIRAVWSEVPLDALV